MFTGRARREYFIGAQRIRLSRMGPAPAHRHLARHLHDERTGNSVGMTPRERRPKRLEGRASATPVLPRLDTRPEPARHPSRPHAWKPAPEGTRHRREPTTRNRMKAKREENDEADKTSAAVGTMAMEPGRHEMESVDPEARGPSSPRAMGASENHLPGVEVKELGEAGSARLERSWRACTEANPCGEHSSRRETAAVGRSVSEALAAGRETVYRGVESVFVTNSVPLSTTTAWTPLSRDCEQDRR